MNPIQGGLACQSCGQHPARYVEFRRHTGVLFWFQHQEFGGSLCKLCGLALFRKYTNHTLIAGWWGLFAFLANFYAIFKNLVNRAKLRSLDLPQEPVAGAPGRSMFLRFGVYFALAGLGFVGYTSYNEIITSEGQALDGECLRITGDQLEEVRCSAPHDGKVVAVIPVAGDEQCPVLADEGFVLDDDEDHVLCIDLDQ